MKLCLDLKSVSKFHETYLIILRSSNYRKDISLKYKDLFKQGIKRKLINEFTNSSF